MEPLPRQIQVKLQNNIHSFHLLIVKLQLDLFNFNSFQTNDLFTTKVEVAFFSVFFFYAVD